MIIQLSPITNHRFPVAIKIMKTTLRIKRLENDLKNWPSPKSVHSKNDIHI